MQGFQENHLKSSTVCCFTASYLYIFYYELVSVQARTSLAIRIRLLSVIRREKL